MAARTRRTRGLTLIELVMVMVTVGLLVAVSSMYIREVIGLWNFASFRNEVVSQGRIAMMRMVREIRQVNNDTALLVAGGSRFKFNDTENNTIDYNFSNGNFTRNGYRMADGVSSLAFVYYDNQSRSLAAPLVNPQHTNIASVNITLGMSASGQSKTFNAKVYPWNFRK